MDNRITRFEDIEGWKAGRRLAARIFQLTTGPNFNRTFHLRDQMQRAAVSITSNIAEGFERSGDKEFRQFLAIAKGSAGELRSQLYIAADANLISAQELEELLKLALDTSRFIGAFITYLNRSTHQGTKYRVSEDSDDEEQSDLRLET